MPRQNKAGYLMLMASKLKIRIEIKKVFFVFFCPRKCLLSLHITYHNWVKIPCQPLSDPIQTTSHINSMAPSCKPPIIKPLEMPYVVAPREKSRFRFLPGLLMEIMPIALQRMPHLSYLMNLLHLIELGIESWTWKLRPAKAARNSQFLHIKCCFDWIPHSVWVIWPVSNSKGFNYHFQRKPHALCYVSYLECKENMKISQRLILTIAGAPYGTCRSTETSCATWSVHCPSRFFSFLYEFLYCGMGCATHFFSPNLINSPHRAKFGKTFPTPESSWSSKSRTCSYL